MLLFDEPLAQLDAPLRGLLREEILRLQRSLGRTTLYVTHDQEEAFVMADRLAFIDHGRLLQVGKPQELYQSPNDIQVAKFLGNPGINLLTGNGRNGNQVEIHGELYRLPVSNEFVEGEEVVIGIRPEGWHCRKGLLGEWQFSVTAERLQFRGHDWVLHGRLGRDSIRVLLPLDAPKPHPNEVLTLACSPLATRAFFPSRSATKWQHRSD
jgi:ABC-type sugar transport system ATPase subunit